MKRRIGTVAIGLAAVVALIAVPAAMAAYASPTLDDHADSHRHYRQGVARPQRRSDGRRLDRRTEWDAADDDSGAGYGARPREGDREGAGPRRRRPSAGWPADRRNARSGSRCHAGRVHRPGRRPAGDVGHGADGCGPDAAGADIPREDKWGARADRPRSHRDLPTASGRSGRNSRPRDVRSQGLQRRAGDQRRVLAGYDRRLGLHLGAVHAGRGQAESRRTGRSPQRRSLPVRSA